MDLAPEQLLLGLVWYVVFLFSTTVHEAAHALAAWKLGDPTAYLGGQVSLNPLPHIQREPFGAVLVPILSYLFAGWMMGWASAPYDPWWADRHPRRAAWMALAGPTSNLLLVILTALAIRLGMVLGYLEAPERLSFTRITAAVSGDLTSVATLLSILFTLNLLLFAFNLLPLPPLDGSGVLPLVMPEKAALRYQEFMRQPTWSLLGILVAWQVFHHIFWPLLLVALKLLYPGVSYELGSEAHPGDRARSVGSSCPRSLCQYLAVSDCCSFTDVSIRAAAGDMILDGVSWSVPETGVGVVIGPSGSGKSRLVRLLNRLDDPTAGEVRVLGRPVSSWDVRELRLRAGWVPQTPALATGTVRDSFTVPVEVGALSAAALGERLPAAMEVAGLEVELLGREIASLSGGERHRVAIARALVLEPSLLVLDEPTGSLDGAAGRALLARLRDWVRQRGSALVVVTHRLADVRALGGSLLMLAGGRVAHAGDAAELLASEAGDRIRALMAGEESSQ